jgi:hypothetical protein
MNGVAVETPKDVDAGRNLIPKKQTLRNFSNVFRRLLPTISGHQIFIGVSQVYVSNEERMDMAAGFAGDGFFSIAKRFRELQDTEPETFETVVKLLGLDRADADVLLRVNRTFRRLRVNKDFMGSLGWPKLIVLVDHISSRNRDELLERASHMTSKELARSLGRHPSWRKRVVLRLTEDQYQVFEQAVLAHGGARDERDVDQLAGKEEALIKALSSRTPKRSRKAL